MTTAPDTTESLSLGQIWQRLSPLIAEAWAQPLSITIHPKLIHAAVEFQLNDRAAVDGAYQALAVLSTGPTFEPGFKLNDGKPTEQRAYGDRYGYLRSPLLPGITLALYCFVQTQADPWVHGEAFGLPPRHACLCCGSQDCPMALMVAR